MQGASSCRPFPMLVPRGRAAVVLHPRLALVFGRDRNSTPFRWTRAQPYRSGCSNLQVEVEVEEEEVVVPPSYMVRLAQRLVPSRLERQHHCSRASLHPSVDRTLWLEDMAPRSSFAVEDTRMAETKVRR